MEEKSEAAGAAQGSGCFFCTTAKPLMEHLWTEVTRDHFREARLEFLRGLRSLLDERIAYLARQEEEHKGTHVPVD